MSEPNDVSVDRVCVSFDEAINWIAFPNFGGAVIGPQRILSSCLIEQDNTKTRWVVRVGKNSRKNCLLSHAAQGKIRLYAGSWTKAGQGKGGNEYTSSRCLRNLSRMLMSKMKKQKADPPLLRISMMKKTSMNIIPPIVVDYEDLTSQFLG